MSGGWLRCAPCEGGLRSLNGLEEQLETSFRSLRQRLAELRAELEPQWPEVRQEPSISA